MPNAITTKYPMLGVDSLMDAIAALKLQEQSKLSVRSTLCALITGCPHAWRATDLREVLADWSGIRRGQWGVFEPLEVGGNIAGLVRLCKLTPLASLPGTPPPDISNYCGGLLLEDQAYSFVSTCCRPSSYQGPNFKSNRIVFMNGHVDWGGFSMNFSFSPDDGAIEVELNNDNHRFNVDAENLFGNHLIKLLWGR